MESSIFGIPIAADERKKGVFMGSSPFQINGRPATESDYKFFYDKLKEAGLQPEALAGDQSFDAGEIRGILGIGGGSGRPNHPARIKRNAAGDS
ncbi:MAG: hypothetical protein K8R69_01890 [Deltaproteobacteria bacterium]|nr:hypothetical protein [Deltaproteobacteria bacterium]